MRTVVLAAMAMLAMGGAAKADVPCAYVNSLGDKEAAWVTEYFDIKANRPGEDDGSYCSLGARVTMTAQNSSKYVQKIMAWCAKAPGSHVDFAAILEIGGPDNFCRTRS